MVDLSKIDRNLFGYTPSAAGNAIFIVLFAVATAGHAYKIWRWRAKYFIPLLVGAFLEFLGYMVRVASRKHTNKLGGYAIQNLFLLVPPALFAATIYMTLSRVIRRLEAEHLPMIRVTRLTRVFVWSDVICFWLQGGAASMQAIQDIPILPIIGKWTVVGGLILQVIIFGFFVVVAGKFHRDILASPTELSRGNGIRWRSVMNVLYITSLLIFVRNTVRVAEYAQGFDGWIIKHEAMLFVFDAAPMVLLVSILYFWHPSDILGGMTAVATEIRDEEEGKGSVDMTTVKLLPLRR